MSTSRGSIGIIACASEAKQYKYSEYCKKYEYDDLFRAVMLEDGVARSLDLYRTGKYLSLAGYHTKL